VFVLKEERQMLEVERPVDMKAYIGQTVGTSEWVLVDQPMINAFADATGDHQWIHIDVDRAKREMPGGKTIAHGFLTLSLIPMLSHQISHINNVKRGINYGCNKVRFTSMVPAGSRVRGRIKLIAADPMDGGGVRLTNQVTIEIEGQERPACVAETMSIVYGA
jgi:acyl dehydratase